MVAVGWPVFSQLSLSVVGEIVLRVFCGQMVLHLVYRKQGQPPSTSPLYNKPYTPLDWCLHTAADTH
ncbi:hypothetical protein XENTR_v10002551 [Xenopus tropicalis]|nr:hypothetical protein XENTR_v10002551 [Xenopus tropicalis]